MTSPKQPTRPGSKPELTSIVTPDQPERGNVRHPGVDGAPQAPPLRKGTLPGGMAAIPARASGEFLPTLPVPNPLQRQTIRRPTPPSAALLARRTPIPPSDDPPGPADAATGAPGAFLSGRIPMSPPIRSASPSPDSGSLPPRKPTRTGGDDGGALTNHRLDMLERGQERSERATGRMTGQLTAVEMAVASLTQEVKLGTARTSSETIKIIVAGVVTVVTAVIGARVTAPTPEPNKTEIVKSSAEIETEACNRMVDDRMKGECLAGVVRHLTEPRQR